MFHNTVPTEAYESSEAFDWFMDEERIGLGTWVGPSHVMQLHEDGTATLWSWTDPNDDNTLAMVTTLAEGQIEPIARALAEAALAGSQTHTCPSCKAPTTFWGDDPNSGMCRPCAERLNQ